MQRKDFSLAIRSMIFSSVSMNSTTVSSRLHEGGTPRSPRTSQSGNSKSGRQQEVKKKDCGSRRSRGSGRWRSAECAGRCLARVDSRLGRRSPEFERCLAKSRQQKNSTFVDPFLAGIVFLTKFGGKVQIQSIDTVAETVLGFLRNGVVDERCLDCLLHVLYKVLSSDRKSVV